MRDRYTISTANMVRAVSLSLWNAYSGVNDMLRNGEFTEADQVIIRSLRDKLREQIGLIDSFKGDRP